MPGRQKMKTTTTHRGRNTSPTSLRPHSHMSSRPNLLQVTNSIPDNLPSSARHATTPLLAKSPLPCLSDNKQQHRRLVQRIPHQKAGVTLIRTTRLAPNGKGGPFMLPAPIHCLPILASRVISPLYRIGRLRGQGRATDRCFFFICWLSPFMGSV